MSSIGQVESFHSAQNGERRLQDFLSKEGREGGRILDRLDKSAFDTAIS